jgi:hypothetical protein
MSKSTKPGDGHKTLSGRCGKKLQWTFSITLTMIKSLCQLYLAVTSSHLLTLYYYSVSLL